MEISKGNIFPPCNVKIGDTDKICTIICPAMFWEKTAVGVMNVDSINVEACMAFLEDFSCPEGYNLQSLEEV